MRVLVTGATGFLGQHLVPQLRLAGNEVVALGSRDADLTDRGSLGTAAPGRYDRIYHLAAWTQAGDFCLKHPGEQWLVNQAINTNVLAWWHAHQPEAFLVTIGTSCSYDEALTMTEANYLAGSPIDSLLTYGMTKRMLWIGQMALAKQFGMRSLTVVPSTLYGPGYHQDGRQPHFIFDLVRKIVRGALYGDAVTLWGHGHQRREVVWVGDFVHALVALPALAVNEVLNVGAGEDYSIREFAAMISALAGYDAARITYDESRYVGAQSKRLEVTRVRSVMPAAPRTTLHDGLSQLIDEVRAGYLAGRA